MCESVMKFESRRPEIIIGRLNSLPPAQNSLTINILNTVVDVIFLSHKGVKRFSKLGEYPDMAPNSAYRLGKEKVLSSIPIFSKFSNLVKTAIAVIFKRNKTRANTVDTGYRFASFQLL